MCFAAFTLFLLRLSENSNVFLNERTIYFPTWWCDIRGPNFAWQMPFFSLELSLSLYVQCLSRYRSFYKPNNPNLRYRWR